MQTASERENTEHTSRWSRLVSLGFRLLYHELAWSYDLVAWLVSFGQWRAWTETVLPYVAGDRVLELGHGPGHLLLSLAQAGFHVVGLDQSPQMSRLARGRLKRSPWPVTLVLGQAQGLPFPDRSFDSVVATFPTAAIVNPHALDEIARTLRPGGRLVAVLGAQLSGRDPLSRFVEWLYAITGQRGPVMTARWQTQFAAAGLAVRWQQIPMQRSQVSLLIAQRVSQGR